MSKAKLPPTLPGIPEYSRNAINSAIRSAARKASPLSWSLAVVISAVSICVWWNRETIVNARVHRLEIQHLQEIHAHCQLDLQSLRAEIAALRREVYTLRTAAN